MRSIIISIIVLIIVGCNENYLNTPQQYTEVPLRKWVNGIHYVESLEPNYSDNIIYNNCLEILYEYHYEKNAQIKYFKLDLETDEWEFIAPKELNYGIGVKYIRLTAVNPNANHNNTPQSAVEYEILNSRNESLSVSRTSVVENYWNIIIHNTRRGFFKSLFSFPWPTVKFPIKENHKWDWKFSYDSSLYGDDRIFNWDGITEMKYSYSYLGEETLNLKFGDIETSKFEAIGTDGTIHNKLIYYFNSKIGFVKQQFFTHDGAKIELEAVEYTNKCK